MHKPTEKRGSEAFIMIYVPENHKLIWTNRCMFQPTIFPDMLEENNIIGPRRNEI